jgi:YTV
MRAKPRYAWTAAVAFTAFLTGQTVLACHICKQTPCVIASPAPAFECVTEMVPFTVMKTKTRVDLVPSCTKTVMETKIDTVYDEQIREVCKPVFDTIFVTRCTTVCRPTCETIMVCQPYTVCRPVTATRQVTEFCMKPYTELITVPVKTKCGLCGHPGGGCTCKTVARTCYRRVPVVREVIETHMETEVQSRMVPVVRWRLVSEQRLEQVPLTTCRLVNQTIRVRVPRLVFKCVPKTLVYKTAVLSCEEIPVTVYRPVVKMVPVVVPSSQLLTPSSQSGTVETKAELPSLQSAAGSRSAVQQKQ